MDLEDEVLASLQRVTLLADEEANIVITVEKRGDILKECSLSLFGKFLTTKGINWLPRRTPCVYRDGWGSR